VKLRIRKDTVRLRVGRSELDQLVARGELFDATHFPAGETLGCALLIGTTPGFGASFSDGMLRIALDPGKARQWASSDEEGIGFSLPLATGCLEVLIEKDFPCTDPAKLCASDPETFDPPPRVDDPIRLTRTEEVDTPMDAKNHVAEVLSDAALDQLFRSARTYSLFTSRPVTEDTLRALYDLTKYGPTAANTQPARFVFVTSPQGKARLKPALDAGNVDKTLAAPVTVIVAYDLHFYEHLAQTFPHAPQARSWYEGKEAATLAAAQRNGSLQGAYLMMAARSLGLDCGPMSGFDNAAVDREFFPDGRWRSNFLCNLGYGDPTTLFPRQHRLPFDVTCRIV